MVVFLSEVFGYTPKVIMECCQKQRHRLSEFRHGGSKYQGHRETIDLVEMVGNPVHASTTNMNDGQTSFFGAGGYNGGAGGGELKDDDDSVLDGINNVDHQQAKYGTLLKTHKKLKKDYDDLHKRLRLAQGGAAMQRDFVNNPVVGLDASGMKSVRFGGSTRGAGGAGGGSTRPSARPPMMTAPAYQPETKDGGTGGETGTGTGGSLNNASHNASAGRIQNPLLGMRGGPPARPTSAPPRDLGGELGVSLSTDSDTSIANQRRGTSERFGANETADEMMDGGNMDADGYPIKPSRPTRNAPDTPGGGAGGAGGAGEADTREERLKRLSVSGGGGGGSQRNTVDGSAPSSANRLSANRMSL